MRRLHSAIVRMLPVNNRMMTITMMMIIVMSVNARPHQAGTDMHPMPPFTGTPSIEPQTKSENRGGNMKQMNDGEVMLSIALHDSVAQRSADDDKSVQVTYMYMCISDK